jgi:hypothetical protein
LRVNPSLLLSLAVMIASAWAVLAATAWPWKAALFPLVIGIPLFLLAAAEFCVTAVGRSASTEGPAADIAPSRHVDRSVALRRTAATFGWLVGFAALIVAVGFTLAVPLFVLLYLRVQASERWPRSLALAGLAWALVHGLFVRVLNLPFAEGLVQAGLEALGIIR